VKISKCNDTAIRVYIYQKNAELSDETNEITKNYPRDIFGELKPIGFS